MNRFKSRRQFLQFAMLGLSSMTIPSLVKADSHDSISLSKETWLDKNLNIEIPNGSVIRQVAQSSLPVLNDEKFHWHSAPDGGACFATEDNGWIYVSNSEMKKKKGGVGAIRFNKQGNIVDAYSILNNTSRNCAGGRTPWDTWLSCEESGENKQR